MHLTGVSAPSPFILMGLCPLVATQVLSNSMHSSGIQRLTSHIETHPLAQLTFISPLRFGPKLYTVTGDPMQCLLLLLFSTGGE